MIYRQPYIIVSALRVNDKAAVSTCQADQLHFSARDGKIQRRRKRVISGPGFAVNFSPSNLSFFSRSITFIIGALTCPPCLSPKLGRAEGNRKNQSIKRFCRVPFCQRSAELCPPGNMPPPGPTTARARSKGVPVTGFNSGDPFVLSPMEARRRHHFPKRLPA